jgi:hypothetical protein
MRASEQNRMRILRSLFRQLGCGLAQDYFKFYRQVNGSRALPELVRLETVGMTFADHEDQLWSMAFIKRRHISSANRMGIDQRPYLVDLYVP